MRRAGDQRKLSGVEVEHSSEELLGLPLTFGLVKVADQDNVIADGHAQGATIVCEASGETGEAIILDEHEELALGDRIEDSRSVCAAWSSERIPTIPRKSATAVELNPVKGLG